MSSDAIYQKGPSTTDAISQGHKNVTTAGTAEALVSASTPAYKVLIQAKSTNGGSVFVGGASVPNNLQGGIEMQARDTITLSITNLTQVYVNSAVNGEGVTYIYWKD